MLTLARSCLFDTLLVSWYNCEVINMILYWWLIFCSFTFLFPMLLCCLHSLSYSKVNVNWSLFLFYSITWTYFRLMLFCKLCNSKVYCGYHPWTGFQTIAIFMQTDEPERSVEVAATISDVVVDSPNKVCLQNYLELIILYL